MTLLDYELFFGFSADSFFEEMVKKANPHIVKTFINNSSEEYLHELYHNGKRYIGKYIGSMGLVNEIELLEKNIYSIAARLAQGYDFKGNPAVLITTPAREKK